MSHYLLAVFTNSRPDLAVLSSLLAPFEESETNSRSKWDWWVLGGCWRGELHIKRGVNDFLLGEPGAFGKPPPTDRADAVRIGNLDLPAMLAQKQRNRASHWDKARERQQAGDKSNPWSINTEEVSRAQYIAQATPFTPFAYLLDGQWHERGQMGWFAVVQDEKPQATWDAEFDAVLRRQRTDHWITVIDCHI